MDVKTSYKFTGNTKALFRTVIPKIMIKVESLVQKEIESYLKDLEKHMGTIPGAQGYSDGSVSWEALDEETLEDSPKFWYQTGAAKNSIVVNLKVSETSIQAFVGVMEGSKGYKETLWNELGFTPKNGNRLIRRPLFLPLADIHKAELKAKLQRILGNSTVYVEI